MGVLEHRVDGSHLHVVRHASQRFRKHQKHRYMVAICKFASSYRTVHGTKRIRSPHACLITIGFRTTDSLFNDICSLDVRGPGRNAPIQHRRPHIRDYRRRIGYFRISPYCDILASAQKISRKNTKKW